MPGPSASPSPAQHEMSHREIEILHQSAQTLEGLVQHQEVMDRLDPPSFWEKTKRLFGADPSNAQENT